MQILQQILTTLAGIVLALQASIASLPPQSQLAQVVSYQTPAFVQGKANQVYNTDPITAVFDSNVTAGNIIAVAVEWGSNTVTLDNITATCVTGNFTLLNNPTTLSTYRAAQGYAVISSSGTCTVTADFSGVTGAFNRIVAHEVSGVDTSNPLDGNTMQSQSDPGNGTDAVTSSNIVTTQNGDYIFGATFDMESGLTAAAGTGFTSRLYLSGVAGYLSEDRIQSSSGSIAATFTQPGSAFTDFITGVMAFRPILLLHKKLLLHKLLLHLTNQPYPLQLPVIIFIFPRMALAFKMGPLALIQNLSLSLIPLPTGELVQPKSARAKPCIYAGHLHFL